MRNSCSPILVGLFSATAAHAQSDLPSESAPPAFPSPEPRPPSFYAAPAAPVTSALVHEQAAAFWGPSPVGQLLDNPLQWGPFQLRPFASYRFTYGNGLNSNPGQQETTAIHEITPGAVLQSRHLSFNYSPTLKYYSSSAFEDGVDHNASANAFFGLGDWTFSLAHIFSKSSSPLIETGTQTPQESHSTSLSAHYQHSQEVSFDFTLSQNIQKADALNNSTTWSSMNWINYHLSEKTLLGAGVGGGYTEQDFGSDSTYEQLQGRIGWRPSEKLNINLNGGFEFRQFLSGPTDNQVDPIMGASLGYTPWEQTSLSLSANHGVSTSILQAESSENTTVSAGLRQRLLGKLNLNLFGSYQKTDYQSIEGQTGLQGERSDEVISFSANLGARIFNKGDISIFYQRSENTSSNDGFDFTSDQYGFQIGYRF